MNSPAGTWKRVLNAFAPDGTRFNGFPASGVEFIRCSRILALLLAALAMETIVNATGDLVGQVLDQLQKAGVITR